MFLFICILLSAITQYIRASFVIFRWRILNTFNGDHCIRSDSMHCRFSFVASPLAIKKEAFQPFSRSKGSYFVPTKRFLKKAL